MSSTNRGYERNSHDYYITPDWIIKSFLDKFLEVELINKSLFILDPSSGGDSINLAPYPKILKEYGFINIRTSDIREDSDSERKGVDYLTVNVEKFDMIITNPPFNLSLEFLKKALEDVVENGFVIFLLRLNFFGSQKRKVFFDENMPKYCFIHTKRPSFIKGSTDSIEYAHFVWQKEYKENFTKTYLI